jgi:hypothetical protein
MTPKKVFLEFVITLEQQKKLDKLSEKWGLSENEVISRIIEIESSSLGMIEIE